MAQATQTIVTHTKNGKPRPTLEITTPAVYNPGVTVELEPGVRGGGRKNTATYKVKLLA